MKFITILLAVFAVASTAVDRSEAAYGRLNEYLIKHVHTDEVAPNMEAASRWLSKQAGLVPTYLWMAPIGDLKKFTALQQVIEDTKCDRTAYEIMRTNADADTLLRLREICAVSRRVDKVMLRILEDHAKDCQEVYLKTYRTKKAQLDETVFEGVKRLSRGIIDANRNRHSYRVHVGFDPNLTPHELFKRYIKYRLTVQIFSSNKLHSPLHNALVSSSRNDPDAKYVRKVPDEQNGKRVLHEVKIKELIRKYLIEPCQQYQAEMGPDLFIPARFDGKFYHELGQDYEYYLGWTYFRICALLTSNEPAVFVNVINAADRN